MTLIILPNLLGDLDDPSLFLPQGAFKAASRITGLFAESEKGGRRYLKMMGASPRLPIHLINEHSKEKDIFSLLEVLKTGGVWGLASDAGLPAIGDPGALLVFLARKEGIEIEAYPGPSAITLSLLLSGLPANRFAFHGYLPIPEPERKVALLHLESDSNRQKATQIFIETPYRNESLIKTMLTTLKPGTWLAAGWNITLPNQGFFLGTLSEWKKKTPILGKVPATFLLYASNPF